MTVRRWARRLSLKAWQSYKAWKLENEWKRDLFRLRRLILDEQLEDDEILVQSRKLGMRKREAFYARQRAKGVR